jgi:hypothetical protein
MKLIGEARTHPAGSCIVQGSITWLGSRGGPLVSAATHADGFAAVPSIEV